MEKHFLSDMVKGPRKFRAELWYNPHGDCLEYQTVDEAVVGDRIDEVLTVYRSGIDNRPIGFQIKGVRGTIDRFGLDGLAVSTETREGQVKSISVAALLLAAYESGPRTVRRRKAYASVMDRLPESPLVPVGDLVAA
jgi:hypothetical protein